MTLRDPNLLMCLESYLIERQNQKKVVPGAYALAARLQTIAGKSSILRNFALKAGLSGLLARSSLHDQDSLVTIDQALFSVTYPQ